MAAKRILWIDDDEDLQLSLTPRLTAEGWEIKTAPSAEEGMALAAGYRPDLIVLDVIMGGEHGFRAAEELKGDPRFAAVPVIMFSSVRHNWNRTTATREDAVESPAEEFVDKSDDPSALIEAIRRRLG